jgi:isochorismate hydrolase
MLDQHLRELAITTLLICGCNFPNCPRTTLYEASERDFRVVFIADATSGTYERGLRELHNIGVSVITTEECLSAIGPPKTGGVPNRPA